MIRIPRAGCYRAGALLTIASLLIATASAHTVLPNARAHSTKALPGVAAPLSQRPAQTSRSGRRSTAGSTVGTTLLSEGFSSNATAPNGWAAFGDACLTAGTASTPATSLPSCAGSAALDAIGQGALQLTSGATAQYGMVIATSPLSTANGLQITFTDYAFDGTTPGADGMTFFLTDASQPLPTHAGQPGKGLAYAGPPSIGITGAYVGVGFDEYGNFSTGLGGPGRIPETLTVRGAAATQYQYLGGATNAAGAAASLPFMLDTPALKTRPANAPTIRATLTPGGSLGVAIDRHDGNGFVTYYTRSIIGIGGQPAVPAKVYFGLSASTGGKANAHQVSGLVVSALAQAASAATTVTQTFTGSATTPAVWNAFGDACLTAGTSATPATSVPACGARAPQDAPGQGALQLNAAATRQVGMVIDGNPLPTANGLQIRFTDYSFNGTTPGGDGLAFFLTDASQPLPTHPGGDGGDLGYAGTSTSGLASAYVAVGFDEFGNFSTGLGGPGKTPETIAVRGAAATGYTYLGGAANAAGKAASLPFSLNQPTLSTRPLTAPTILATLTPAGVLSVAIDRHDGAGFGVYYAHAIVGVGGQTALPARVYFGLSAATGGTWNVHQISGLTITTSSAVPLTSAADNPPALVSSNGSLVFNVSARANASTGRPQLVYNGSPVPPTLRLLPGDTLVVNLTNALPAPPSGSGYSNDTNLHFHGLHVSPQAPGDDEIDMLAAPGQSLHYSVAIPLDHPPGLYWYHMHPHGEAERQTLAGMSGALIVDGIAAYTPQIAAMTERILIARDAPLAGAVLPSANLAQMYAMNWAMRRGVTMHAGAAAPGVHAPGARSEYHASSTLQTRDPYVTVDAKYRRFIRSSAADTHCVAGSPEAPLLASTLNGQTVPSIRIAPGEQQFWRVVNAGADTYLDIAVDNTQLQVIALDGVPLSSGAGVPATMTFAHWVLPPASRVEFIVTGPPAGSTSYLRTNCFDAGSAGNAMPAEILAVIDPTAAPAVAQRTRRAPAVARVSSKAIRFRFHTLPTLRAAAAIRATAVSATRTLYYSDQNTINGLAYDPAAPPQFYAQSGTVEEWTIQNNSAQVHTFHIHQIHFVLEAVNGVAQAQQFVLDNVNVPAATAGGPGTVKLLLDFTDPIIIGTFLLHCHILAHEDAGMMAKIRIGTAPPLKLSAASVTFAAPTSAIQHVTISGGAAPYSLTGCSGVAGAAVNANTIAIAPAGAGACVLTIADASSPSITATITVSVGAGDAVVTLAPTAVSFTAPTAAAQTVTISGGTAPYTAAGCSAIATETIAARQLSVTPQTPGACSIVVSDANVNQATLSVAVNAPTTGNPLDSLTFHGNTSRTGWYQHETTLTTATVGSSNFGRIATLAAPAGMIPLGKVYAQPLFVTNEKAIDGAQHNLVIVAGAAAQIYAFDETTRAAVWGRSFTNAAAGIRQQLWSDTGCSDVNPDLGIIGTPVIDRARDAIYVVVATMENGVPYTRLHAIGLGNGNDVIAPTVISGSVALATGGTASISSVGNLNRPALLEANGNIYVALGSHCDQNAGSVHGWMIAYSAATLEETGSLADVANANNGSNYYLGAVWMSGFGPAADAQGNIYFATGNGPTNGTSNFAMSIVKVPGNLNLAAASYFAPIQAAADSSADLDLGSGGVVLLPDQTGTFQHLLVAGGKCSANNFGCFKYILNRDALGAQQTGNAGAVWSASIAAQVFGGPAYFMDAAGVQHILYGGNPLNTYKLSLAPIGLAVQTSTAVGCLECRDSGSQPIVSSNGTSAGSAVAWALKTPGNSGGSITLYAFDPLNMGTTLFAGVAGTWTQAAGSSHIGGALVSPLVANGRVYVPTDGSVAVFGLLHE